MEKQSKIIFLSALAISLMFHFIILKLSPEVEYKNKKESKDNGLHIVNAVVIKKPVNKVSKQKALSTIKTRMQKKRIKTTSVTVKKVKSIKKEDSPAHKLPDELIENKLKNLESNYNKLITPLGRGSQEAKANSRNLKRRMFIPFYKVDKRPDFLYKAELKYPLKAKQLGVEGTVILEADIDTEGKIINIRIIKKAGFGFDEAALNMIKMSKFSPAYSNGKPVPVRMRFTILFKLE